MKKIRREDYKNIEEYGRAFLAHGAANLYKYLDYISGGFYNCKKILTYGRPFNFITSSRSAGKSTSVAIFVLLEYVVNNREFIYCRRDKDTVLLTAPKFFNNAISLYNNKLRKKFKELREIIGFRYNGGKYQIAFTMDEDDNLEWEECGVTIPLSIEAKSKSTPFGNVYNIIFDEFIERDPTKYLGTSANQGRIEFDAIMSLYESVDRREDQPIRNETRVFFLGNIGTLYCPLYLMMGIAEYIVDGANFVAPKGKTWAVEKVRDVEAMKEKEHSFAYLAADETHRKYAFSTETDDDKSFIAKPEISVFMYNVKLEGKTYGIRRCPNSAIGEMYIGKYEEGHMVYSLDTKSHNGLDFQLISSWRKFPIMVTLHDLFERGLLYFDNGETKNVFLKYLQFM